MNVTPVLLMTAETAKHHGGVERGAVDRSEMVTEEKIRKEKRNEVRGQRLLFW